MMKAGARIALVTVAIALASLASFHPARADDAPRRVVSINVCTDQMAMLIADPEQLHSVSFLAADDGSSVMTAQARNHVLNHAQAEEISLMQPDLVLGGTFTSPATVQMLRRLGFRVELFAPEADFDDIRVNLRRIGDLLGHRDRAEALVAKMDAALDEASASGAQGVSVAMYSSNNYTSGKGSLSDAVIKAAGMSNIADRLGIVGIGQVPLETLVLARPDLVVVGEQRFEAPALAQQNFVHPAFAAIAPPDRLVEIPGRYWVCGAPFTVDAVRMLRQAAARYKETHP